MLFFPWARVGPPLWVSSGDRNVSRPICWFHGGCWPSCRGEQPETCWL